MFYNIVNKETIIKGDYGDTLQYGWVSFEEENGKYIKWIERVGPFVPNIYETSGAIVFLDNAKRKFEENQFNGAKFILPAEKRKIVNIDWQKWPLTDPKFVETDYLNDNVYSPYDLIENGDHDPELSKLIPDLWIPEITQMHLINDNSQHYLPNLNFLSINKKEWQFIDICQGIEHTGFFVSSRLKNWLESNYHECFDFCKIKTL